MNNGYYRERKSGSAFKSFIIFLICLAVIYAAVFTVFITQDNLIGQMQSVIKTVFQRDSDAMSMSLSPLGNFSAKGVTVSSRGGFKNGTLGTINSISAKLEILNIFTRKLVLKDLYIDGFDISFGRKSFRQFRLSRFESYMRQFTNSNKIGQLLNNGVEIKGITISGGNSNLKINDGNIKFRNITIRSRGYNATNLIDGDIALDIEGLAYKTHLTTDFIYNKREKTLYIKGLRASNMTIRGDIKIKFLNNGASADYDMTITKEDYQKFTNLIGKDLLSSLNVLIGSNDVSISNR
ncbi:MAG: hypothetical protein LBN20_02555 [Endomicrobium sp.]|jgi:hypothetical protein|nr:hypothetical protein [Endomicrobium sp.]